MQTFSLRPVRYALLATLAISMAAAGHAALSEPKANYAHLYAVSQGDKVSLDPRAFRAEFDALDRDNSVYAAGRALNNSFDCYTVPQDGRLGVMLGDVVIRKREAADSVPLPNPASAMGFDYDGDGKDDPVLVINGVWHVWASSIDYAHIPEIDLGLCGSTFLAGDLDGDGRPDAVMSAANAWTVWFSSTGYANSVTYYLDLPGEPVLGDFDGDRKADPASVDDGVLHAYLSGQNYSPTRLELGIFGLPVTGDFDQDGKDDLILAADSWWQIFYSSRCWANPETVNLGAWGLPAIADFDGDSRDDIAMYDSAGGWWLWQSADGYSRSGPFALSAAAQPVVQALILAQSNQTVALVDVSDGKDTVRDAAVSVNGTRLNFGLPFDATNILYGITNLDAVSVYYGELPAITAGVPVQVTVVNRDGNELYRSASHLMPGAVRLTAPTNGQVLSRSSDNDVIWTGGEGAQAFSVFYLAQTGDPKGNGALMEVLPATANQWRLAGCSLVSGTGIVQVAALAGDMNTVTGEVDAASFTLLQHLDLVEIVAPEAVAGATPRDITITPAAEVLQIARIYEIITTPAGKPLRWTIHENDPLQIEAPGVVTLPFKCTARLGIVLVTATDIQGNRIYSAIRAMSNSKPDLTFQFAVPENTFIKISTLFVNYLGGSYTGTPYERTPTAAVLTEQNLAGERMAYAWVGDPYQPIPNASVWINNIQLQYGMDLSFTNDNLRIAGPTLPIFSGSLAAIDQGAPVAATVRDEDGSMLLSTAAYTFPAPTQLVWPTNGAVMTTYSPVPMEWTPSSDARAYQATYLGVDDNDLNDDIGLYTETVSPTANTAVIPASALRPGLGFFRVDALNGELAKFENPPEFFSFLLVSSSDDATTYLSPPIYEGLQIAKEYGKKIKGLRFTIREGNAYQVVAPGTVAVTIKMRRYKISVAFVAAVDQNGQVYYTWSKERFFKSKNKTYTVTFNVQPGTTVVIGTHDASYRGGSYTY